MTENFPGQQWIESGIHPPVVMPDSIRHDK